MKNGSAQEVFQFYVNWGNLGNLKKSMGLKMTRSSDFPERVNKH